MSADELEIGSVSASAYRVPTDAPESDGTATWDSTTLVLVEVAAGEVVGVGYSYGDPVIADLINGTLAELLLERDPLSVSGCWQLMVEQCRNLGRPGIASMAISAIDTALWDLKARVLDVPVAVLLDQCHREVPIYGSGGFTSYDDDRLAEQLGGWVADGIPRVKMKVGREPGRDLERVRVARQAIGDDAELFIDANGAFGRKQALRFAEEAVMEGASWFEEPVSSDDLDGLRLVRDRAPAGMEVAAGEYGFTLPYFERMLASGAVDCLQADCTRCEGYTGFMRVAALCEARSFQFSAHCAPALNVHVCAAITPLRHLEYFHDHVRIEQMLFDGALQPQQGTLLPDLSRPGNGLEFKRADAEQYAM